MSRQHELSMNIGHILLASNTGAIDPHEASALIAGLVEAAAMHAVVEGLKRERVSRSLRPRVRLAQPALV